MYFITYSVKYDEVIHPSNKIENKNFTFLTSVSIQASEGDLNSGMVSFRGKPHNRESG